MARHPAAETARLIVRIRVPDFTCSGNAITSAVAGVRNLVVFHIGNLLLVDGNSLGTRGFRSGTRNPGCEHTQSPSAFLRTPPTGANLMM